MKRSFAVVALLAAWLAPARAQQAADQVTYVDAAKVAEAFAKGGALDTGSDHVASVLRRVKPGQVEVHTKETDTFYIVDGTRNVRHWRDGRRPEGGAGEPADGHRHPGRPDTSTEEGRLHLDPGRHSALVQGRAVERHHLLHGEGGEAVGQQLRLFPTALSGWYGRPRSPHLPSACMPGSPAGTCIRRARCRLPSAGSTFQ